MKPIATDTYNFEQLINDNYTYVDKTEVLYQLVNKSIGKQFFLSRPRRFGKSLLVSTFKSLFQGRRDLFKGLAIDSLDFPNMEVRNSFNASLARGYVDIDENHLGALQNRCIDALYDNELNVFFETLKIFFANIPYEKFIASGKKITLVGVNFDSEKRTIAEWVTEVI